MSDTINLLESAPIKISFSEYCLTGDDHLKHEEKDKDSVKIKAGVKGKSFVMIKDVKDKKNSYLVIKELEKPDKEGDLLVIYNGTTIKIEFEHANAEGEKNGSSIKTVTGKTKLLLPNNCIKLIYTDNNWVQINHL